MRFDIYQVLDTSFNEHVYLTDGATLLLEYLAQKKEKEGRLVEDRSYHSMVYLGKIEINESLLEKLTNVNLNLQSKTGVLDMEIIGLRNLVSTI